MSKAVRLKSAVVNQNGSKPVMRQSTLDELLQTKEVVGRVVAPRLLNQNKRKVQVLESSENQDTDDDDDDVKSIALKKIGSQETPIELDDESESSYENTCVARKPLPSSNSRKKQRMLTSRLVAREAGSKRASPLSCSQHETSILQRKVASASTKPTVFLNSDDDDDDDDDDVVMGAKVNELPTSGWNVPARCKPHGQPNALPLARNLFPRLADSSDEEFDDSTDDECVREVAKFEANNLKVQGPYKFEEFEVMWKQVEMNLGETTVAIENGRLIRGANKKMTVEDPDVQSKAQYGRLLPFATNKLLTEIFGLNERDVFLDFGHGIGNACLQAAYTIGCEARGIEVVSDRHLVAQQFCTDLAQLNDIRLKKDSIKHKVGNVLLREGSLESSKHRTFLTEGVTAAFVNNFNGVFRERSTERPQLRFLDDYLSGLFAMMSPGAKLISLHPLPLCLSKSDANERRSRFGWEASENASFFEFEEMDLGEARYSVSWSEGGGCTKMIRLFKYTRVPQTVNHSIFLCCNPNCEKAKNAVPINATVENSDGRVVLNKCDCGFEACNLRSRGGQKKN